MSNTFALAITDFVSRKVVCKQTVPTFFALKYGRWSLHSWVMKLKRIDSYLKLCPLVFNINHDHDYSGNFPLFTLKIKSFPKFFLSPFSVFFFRLFLWHLVSQSMLDLNKNEKMHCNVKIMTWYQTTCRSFWFFSISKNASGWSY